MSLAELAARYARPLSRMDDHLTAGLRRWPWERPDPMRRRVEVHLRRRGKRLRPLFAAVCVDLLGGDLDKVAPVGAALELYHRASLVLDDVQDNASFRDGDRAVHVDETVSNAINLAGIVRSLCYYPVHDAAELTVAEKLVLHHELDTMATLVPLGQSIEIGWHQGWYDDDARGFPYRDMIRLKTGAPFACAAASAAVVSGVDGSSRSELRELGFRVGSFYQLVDDFRDMFASPSDGTPPDLAAGTPSRPLWSLVELLGADRVAIERVRRAMRVAGGDRRWILDMMREVGVEAALDAEISCEADRLCAAFDRLATGAAAARDARRFVDACRELAHGP